jgi:F-type H+-transporting ATPase subunit b
MVVANIHFTELNALASETGKNWRPTYDTVMIWLNFGIFAFLLVKYLKTPLINFLRGRQDELAEEINRLEEQREQISQKINATQQLFEKSEAHYEDIKAKIISQGEEKKREIIEAARQESRLMIEHTNVRIGNQILQAKNKFKSEMIDLAFSLAMKRLPDEITIADHQKLLDRYIEHTSLK